MIDPSFTDPDLLRGIAAIAQYRGKSKVTTLNDLKAGRLPAFRIGAGWVMRRSTYDAHLARLEADAIERMRAAA